MPHLGPIKRKDLIYYLRQLDFEGPYPGGNHQYMVKVKERLTVNGPESHGLFKPGMNGPTLFGDWEGWTAACSLCTSCAVQAE